MIVGCVFVGLGQLGPTVGIVLITTSKNPMVAQVIIAHYATSV